MVLFLMWLVLQQNIIVDTTVSVPVVQREQPFSYAVTVVTNESVTLEFTPDPRISVIEFGPSTGVCVIDGPLIRCTADGSFTLIVTGRLSGDGGDVVSHVETNLTARQTIRTRIFDPGYRIALPVIFR